MTRFDPQFNLETDILVATIGRPHGVRGHVHLHAAVSDPESVEAFDVLHDQSGRGWHARWVSPGVASLRADGGETLADRNAAERLVNTRLYVPRAALPDAEDEEFYHADLVGLTAETAEGAPLGTVGVVHDYGAGASLEIVGDEGTFLVAFTRANVPVVDLPGRRVVVIRPAEIEVEGALEGDVEVRS